MNLNKPVGEPGHIYLIGIDGTPYDHDMIRNRKLDAAVSQPLLMYAKLGVKYIMDAFAGIEVKLGPTDHDSEIVIQKGIIQDLLPSRIVTLANVDDPDLWGNMVKGY
jgi:ABC-type sugar transport system substrate-binding protein